MHTVNPFVLCNLATKLARATHNIALKPMRLELFLKADIREAVQYLKSGTQEEQNTKNFRLHNLSFVREEDPTVREVPFSVV